MLLPSTDDDVTTLGVAPSAVAARASKRILAVNTLVSARALCDGLVDTGYAGRDDLSRSFLAIERLERILQAAERPADVVEPVFYEWYFRGIELLKRGDLPALARHARRASAVAAVPLMQAGSLEAEHGDGLEVDLPDDGRLILSEREWRGGAAPVVGAAARLGTRGPTLVVSSAGHELAFDWRCLVEHGRYAVPGSPMIFQQTGHAARRIVAEFQRDLAPVHDNADPFRLVPPREFDPVFIDRFGAGLALIRRCWPELYDETCVMTDQFAVIEGVPFIGGSAISYLGVSFLNLLPQWSDACFADHIVHEEAHQRLHVEFELEPALANGDFRAAISPIRRDPRPLNGVLHATFVFLRLALFFQRVLEREPSRDAEQRFHRHALGLYSGLERLERYGRWNPRGERLFAAMYTAADRLRAVLPRPDPELYGQLGPDYEAVSALAEVHHG